MSVMTLLNLNAVCYTHDVPDDVIRIIIEYVKTHTLKNKFNSKFMKGQQCMIADDIIYGTGIFHTTYQGPFVIMQDWDMDGFMPTNAEWDGITWHGGATRVVENQLIGEIDIEYLTDACKSSHKFSNDGTLLVGTITDYYETEGAQVEHPGKDFVPDPDYETDGEDPVEDWTDSDED